MFKNVQKDQLHAMLTFSIPLALLLGSACGGKGAEDSKLGDIYKNDVQTRHKATPEERAWVVNVGGCSGSMLNAKLLLTANHCQPQVGARYTTGAASNVGRSQDLVVERVAEANSQIDFSIVEVKWQSGAPTPGQKYTPFISTKASDLVFGRDGVGSKLFTVGFPVDKNSWGATYAEGYAKKYEDNYMLYNVGSINGNSGGAVWRAQDKMLVGQTNFGPHSHGQPGWDNNEPENPAAWNGGGAMYKALQASATLRDIFPNGNNRFVDDNGNLEAFD